MDDLFRSHGQRSRLICCFLYKWCPLNIFWPLWLIVAELGVVNNPREGSLGSRWTLLILRGFTSHSRIFYSHMFEDVTITGMDICSAQMAIEHWGFFIVPHLMWHRASVKNGHVTHTYCKRLAVELSLPVFMTSVRRGWDSNTQLSACGANALTHCMFAWLFC